MVRTELFCDRSRVFSFAEVVFLENKGKRFKSASTASEQCYEAARVNSSRQEDSHGNVADQLQAHRIFQYSAYLICKFPSLLLRRDARGPFRRLAALLVDS